MTKFNIITNNTPRYLYSYLELSDKVRTEFDYLSEEQHDELRFVKYKQTWYDVYESVCIVPRSSKYHPPFAYIVDDDSELAKFDCMAVDSYYSGICFRMVQYVSVIVGRYISV